MKTWLDSQERPSIADLEIYGLSVRAITGLEEDLGVIYVDQLQNVTEAAIRAIPHFGPVMVGEVRTALQNWLAGQPVKTVRECIEMNKARPKACMRAEVN
jgi:hypothetical protein